uniref:Uncharacterized protein n=1 Tax=Prymnesium polylepis TaxID=72548 RepID=A0A7S4M1T0_9EUKA
MDGNPRENPPLARQSPRSQIAPSAPHTLHTQRQRTHLKRKAMAHARSAVEMLENTHRSPHRHTHTHMRTRQTRLCVHHWWHSETRCVAVDRTRDEQGSRA